ncbi:MAG: glucosaminidase domain-containing protein [Sphingobacteriaceae bacterium]
MKKIGIVCLVFSLLVSSCGIRTFFKPDAPASKTIATKPGATNTNAEAYIDQFKQIAIQEMNANGIPASITLAQGLLESGNGKSDLAVQANNHFGIKCAGDWAGKTILKNDDTENECFRVYKNPEDSYKDHSEFLKRKRYAALFELDKNDYKSWAKGLKEAGYATNPKYPDLLIGLIERYQLNRFDVGEKAGEKIARESKVATEIKTNTSEAPNTEAIKAPVKMVIYEVKANDSLAGIAQRFKVSVEKLKQTNALSSETVYLGQLLVIAN